MRYGTSCFLQMLDDEQASLSKNRILMARDEWLARVEALKSKFQRDLSSLFAQINRDYTYSTCPITAAYHAVNHENVPP